MRVEERSRQYLVLRIIIGSRRLLKITELHSVMAELSPAARFTTEEKQQRTEINSLSQPFVTITLEGYVHTFHSNVKEFLLVNSLATD